MIKKKEVYVAYCDECGESLMYDDVEVCYDTEEDVKSQMGWSEWEWIGDKVYCPECIEKCIEYDADNDTYVRIPNESRVVLDGSELMNALKDL